MKMFARIYRAETGSVALEFGLLSFAFVGLAVGIFEIGFMLFAQISLDYATEQSARALLTGNAKFVAGTSQQTFQSSDFCGYLAPLITCSGVTIVLQPVTNYQTSLTNETAPSPTSTVNPGGPGSMMMLQAYYTVGLPLWPVSASTLVSTAAFVNEY
jgi:Flp pilus assembly protein TadG